VVQIKSPESWKRVFEIEIQTEQIESGFDARLKAIKSDIQLPGFRKGNVPLSIIKSKYGESIKGEVMDKLIRSSIKEAIEAENLDPIAPPKISQISYQKGTHLKFEAEIEIEPDITLKGYTNTGIKAKAVEVTKDEVDKALVEYHEQFAKAEKLDRKSQIGDILDIEYLDFLVGGADKKGTQKNRFTVELGKGTLPELDKALMDVKGGDVIEGNFTFPKDYSNPDLAGKETQYKILVHQVAEK